VERAMLGQGLGWCPIEAVVRCYLVGCDWAESPELQSVCGIRLPADLSNGDRPPAPIYTPAYKAPLGMHDENITFAQTVALVGEADATALRELSLRVFGEASAIAAQRGVILADTRFEFGRDPSSGEITLPEEVLTSDSSRSWDAEAYAAGGENRLDSFDKQIVRNWLAAHWDKHGTPPPLPPEIVERTAARYRELIERLTA